MPKLELDPVSAKTLPYLDKLYAEGNIDKLTEILTSTPAEPLRRLTLAAISRHTVLAPVDLEIPSNSVKLLEELIKMNLKGDGDLIAQVLDVTGNGEVSVFIVSLARWYSMGV